MHQKQQGRDPQSPLDTFRWTGRHTWATCIQRWWNIIKRLHSSKIFPELFMAELQAWPPLEPKQPQSASETYFWLEDLSDGHASINELLTSLVTDTGHERSWLTDQTELLKGKNNEKNEKQLPSHPLKALLLKSYSFWHTHSCPRVIHWYSGRRQLFSWLNNSLRNKVIIYRAAKLKITQKLITFRSRIAA